MIARPSPVSLALRGNGPNDSLWSFLLQKYVDNQTAFFDDWVTQFQEMSLIGVDPAPAGFGVHDGFLPGQRLLTINSLCLCKLPCDPVSQI